MDADDKLTKIFKGIEIRKPNLKDLLFFILLGVILSSVALISFSYGVLAGKTEACKDSRLVPIRNGTQIECITKEAFFQANIRSANVPLPNFKPVENSLVRGEDGILKFTQSKS